MDIRVIAQRDRESDRYEVTVPGMAELVTCDEYADIRIAVREALREAGNDTRHVLIYIDGDTLGQGV